MKLAPAAAALLFVFTAATTSPATDIPTVLVIARQRIETTDSRATGRLVRIDGSGNRVSSAFTIKAHAFPGVLRVLLEIVPSRPPAEHTAPDANDDARVSILLETRPEGQNTIRVFHPHQSAPTLLPFREWSGAVFGSDFDYEDFLQAEYFWQGQVVLKSVECGSKDCDVLKSTPGASDRSHYAQVQTWLDRTIGYPIYAEKTLRSAAVVKTFASVGVSQSGGVWSARQVEVKTHGRPGSTLLIFERGSTRANLTLKDFSPEQISQNEDRP